MWVAIERYRPLQLKLWFFSLLNFSIVSLFTFFAVTLKHLNVSHREISSFYSPRKNVQKAYVRWWFLLSFWKEVTHTIDWDMFSYTDRSHVSIQEIFDETTVTCVGYQGYRPASPRTFHQSGILDVITMNAWRPLEAPAKDKVASTTFLFVNITTFVTQRYRSFEGFNICNLA